MSLDTRYALALLEWLKGMGFIGYHEPLEDIEREIARFMDAVEIRAAVYQVTHESKR